MTHDLFSLRVGVVSSVPASPSKVSAWQPRFVNVNHVVALAVDLKHLLSEDGAKNLILFQVSMIRNSFDATVRKPKLLLHHTHNWARRYSHASIAFHTLLYLLNVPDALVLVDGTLHNSYYDYLIEDLAYFSFAFIDKVCLLSFEVFFEVAYDLHLYVKHVGHFLSSSLTCC